MGFTREVESPCPRVEGPTPQLATKRSLVPGVLFFLSLVPGARWYPTLKPRQFFHTKTNQALAGTLHKTKTIFPHCTKIKNIFIVVLIRKPFLKFPDKLIGKGCPTTGVLNMWNEKQRIASLHLAETLRPTALPHDSAVSYTHLTLPTILLV